MCRPFYSVLKGIIKLDVPALPEASGTDSPKLYGITCIIFNMHNIQIGCYILVYLHFAGKRTSRKSSPKNLDVVSSTSENSV